MPAVIPDVRYETVLEDLGATAALAHRLAVWLRPGDVLAIEGDMGSGKTTLTRALAGARGLDQSAVSSPTFVIAADHGGLVHVDAYRVGDEDELDAIGWDRLTEPGRVVVIEWPSKIPAAIDRLGDRVIRAEMWQEGPASRGLRLVAPGERFSARGPIDGAPASDRTDTVCPVTGAFVPAGAPTWPFVDERARMADLYRWFSGSYTISRDATQADLEQGE